MGRMREQADVAVSFLDEPLSRRAPVLPEYLVRTYHWAYLNPRSIRLLDNPLVVSTILFGNYRRLTAAALSQFAPGQSVLQPACVYGDLSARLLAHLTPRGQLTISDVAALQVDNCRRKIGSAHNLSLSVQDAADPRRESYDGVCCFFLLHEMPAHYRHQVVDNLLDAVNPGGRVVFVDYHRPRSWNPLRPLIHAVFHYLEPYAAGLTETEIQDLASDPGRFTWTKRDFFGGLYQMVVAERQK